MMRILIQLDSLTNDEFDKEVHLFSTNEDVHNHNRIMLYSLRYPVARSLATKTMNGNIVEDGSSDELELELLISKYSKVMLTKNIWIEAGLVNGALGYIWNIVYRPRISPPELPAYVTIEFDNYSRIPFDDDHTNIVLLAQVEKGRTLQLQLG